MNWRESRCVLSFALPAIFLCLLGGITFPYHPVRAGGAGGQWLVPIQDGFFVQGIAGELAPWIPYDAFFGECPRMVHRDSVTYYVYTDPHNGMYLRTYDHRTRFRSQPSYIDVGWNDHVRPALLIDDEAYLHVLYGARPSPLRYVRSTGPLAWSSWSNPPHEAIGTSATYPVPIILDGRIFVIYREGNSYAASLSFAVRDLESPSPRQDSWTVTTLVATSSDFVPMPLAVFEERGRACFLLNMRDALLSSPHVNIAPSIREGLAVICTEDGSTFTDMAGNILDLPLDYEAGRERFPLVLDEEIFTDTPTITVTADSSFSLGDLDLDGSFVELVITKDHSSPTTFSLRNGGHTYITLELTGDGRLLLSNGAAVDTAGDWDRGTPMRIRLKLHFSSGHHRAWIDGTLGGPPREFIPPTPPIWKPAAPGIPLSEPIAIDSLSVDTSDPIEIAIRTGREYKLITASACPGPDGAPHYFFIDRRDSSIRSSWTLMHAHDGTVREIGDGRYHKYHPSSIHFGGRIFVAVAYFEGDGLFLQNDHLCPSSDLYLLGSTGGMVWEEMRLTDVINGQVHPIFKREDGSGILELSWTNMIDASTAYLMHGYFTDRDTSYAEQPDWPGLVLAFPNPFEQATTLNLKLGTDAAVTIAIYDAAGRLVKRLLEEKFLTSGMREVTWRGEDERGNRVTPGVYFARVRTGGMEQTCKIVLIE